MNPVLQFPQQFSFNKISADDLRELHDQLGTLLFPPLHGYGEVPIHEALITLTQLTPRAKKALEDSGFTVDIVAKHYSTGDLSSLRAVVGSLHHHVEAIVRANPSVHFSDPNSFETYNSQLSDLWSRNQREARDIFNRLRTKGHYWTSESIKPIVTFVQTIFPLTELHSARDLCDTLGCASELLPDYPLVSDFYGCKESRRVHITVPNLFGFVTWIYSCKNPVDFAKKIPPMYISD